LCASIPREANRSGRNVPFFLFTPKGLYPPAQGQHAVACATLGDAGAASFVSQGALEDSRPWAGGYNPFGVKKHSQAALCDPRTPLYPSPDNPFTPPGRPRLITVPRPCRRRSTSKPSAAR